MAILEQHALDRRPARRLHALEMLRHRGAQFALAPGVKPAETPELRGDRGRIEKGRSAAWGLHHGTGRVGHLPSDIRADAACHGGVAARLPCPGPRSESGMPHKAFNSLLFSH